MVRARLNPDIVVGAAIQFGDAHGISALTVTALAKHLGVAGPALYKHVAGIDGLRELMRVRLLRELVERLRRATTARVADDAVRLLSAEYREFAKSHPGAYELTLAAGSPDEAGVASVSDEILDLLVRIVENYEIEGPAVIDAARFIRAALHGFVSLELAGGFGLPREVDNSFEALQSGMCHALATWGMRSA